MRKAFATVEVLRWPGLLRESDGRDLWFGPAASEESIVVHCLTGIGRTGHVLAPWLVAARGYGPDEAITTVSKSGRTPDEAVKAGNVTHEGLLGLLQSVA